MQYNIDFASLGKLTNEEYALAIVRLEQLKALYPATVQASSQAQREFVQVGIEHPLAELYKARTGEKRAACSANDLQRFAGVSFPKGEKIPLEIKLKVFAGRLLERKLATQEEIAQAMEQGESATFEALPENEAGEGDAERGIDSL